MRMLNKNRVLRKVVRLAPSCKKGWERSMNSTEQGIVGEKRPLPNALGFDATVQIGFVPGSSWSKVPELNALLKPKITLSVANPSESERDYVTFRARKRGWKAATSEGIWVDNLLRRNFNYNPVDHAHVYDEDAPVRFLRFFSEMSVKDLVYSSQILDPFKRGFHKKLEKVVKEIGSDENPQVKRVLEIVGKNNADPMELMRGNIRRGSKLWLSDKMLKLYAKRFNPLNPVFLHFPWQVNSCGEGDDSYAAITTDGTYYYSGLPRDILVGLNVTDYLQTLRLEKKRALNNSELATIVFSDCRSRPIRRLPRRELAFSGVVYKLPEGFSDDAGLLRTFFHTDRTRTREEKGLYPPPMSITTECMRLEGDKKDIFAKRLNAPKLPYCDYELDMASRMNEKGIDIQQPLGIAVLAGVPWALFEYADNAVSLMGVDSSYRGTSISPLLHEKEQEVYTSLGRYVREMLDKGVYDRDMAKRNFMAQFSPAGQLERVFMVDYEKTVAKKRLFQKERETALRQLTEGLSESERQYFQRGYEGAD